MKQESPGFILGECQDGIVEDAQDFFNWFSTFYDETYFHMVYVDGER